MRREWYGRDGSFKGYKDRNRYYDAHGNYCGYYFGVPETAEGWHLENDAILDSPCVDFQCSPSIYGAESRRRGCGQYARCLLEG